VATLRAPFTGFTVSWRHLPTGISNAGTTTFMAAGPAPVAPFNINLSLTANGAAAEGLYPVELVLEAVGEPGVETVLWIRLNVTRPLADVFVEPLRPDEVLPLPAQTVQVSTNVSNIGFDNLAGVRIVASIVGPNSSELLNLSWGALAPGQSVPIAFNFTANYGLQVVTVAAWPEPGQDELQMTNNVRTLSINISRFLVEVEAPFSRVQAAQVGGLTPVPVTVYNRGTDDDNYTLTALSLSDPGWTVGLPTSSLFLTARTLGSLVLNVTSPTSAEGGSSLTFLFEARSQSDGSVFSRASVTVEILEVFNASVTISQYDVEVPYRGTVAVEATVLNRGNGHETFSLSVQQGDAKLGTASNVSVMTLAPGAAGRANLTLRDLGLLSTERPYVLELLAISQGLGSRFSGIISVRVEPHGEVTVDAIERSVVLSPDQPTTFHVNLTNIGNTNAVVALTASSLDAHIVANISATGALLLPGDTLVVNGTASLSSLPPAGPYTIAVRAIETRTNGSALANVSVVVPAVHDIVASLGPGLTAPPTPRTQTVTITIENRGNVAETVDIILGFIRVDVRVRLSPAAGRITMPAFSNATVEVFIEATSSAAYSGQVPVEIFVASSGTTVPVSVPYTFTTDTPDTSLLWVLATAGAAAAFAGFLIVRRAAPRAKLPSPEKPETPTSKPPP
jgi:hypothetical protein